MLWKLPNCKGVDMDKAKADPRADRETRESTERPRKWMPPTLLPDPKPEEGYKFRWIRITNLGESDPRHIATKLREGWEPVKASEHPEIVMVAGSATRFPDSIEIGGLLLCKTPIEMVEQRNQYYQDQANALINSVDNTFMRASDARMPLFKERQTQVTFGRGNS